MSAIRVVIVSCNACDLLRECLQSLAAEAAPVVVVDNASTDGSADMVEREFPAVRLLRNGGNLGFAAACNQGAAMAESRFLLFLNPDTRVFPGTIAKTVDYLERHPDVGVMGCRTLNPDGRLQASAFPFPRPLRVFAYVAGLNRCFRLSRFSDHSRPSSPDYVQGAFLAMPRQAFADCGGFDESFFLFFEEVDLCLRLRQQGWRVAFTPQIEIVHHRGGSGAQALGSLRHYVEGSLLFFRKHRTPGELRRLRRALRWGLRLRQALLRLRSPRLATDLRNEFAAMAALLAFKGAGHAQG